MVGNMEIQAELENLKELMGHLANILGDKESLDNAGKDSLEGMEVTVGGDNPDDIMKGLDLAKGVIPTLDEEGLTEDENPEEDILEGGIEEPTGLDAIKDPDLLKEAMMKRLSRR